MEFEKEITSNIKHSLQNILHKIWWKQVHLKKHFILV
jgi:hypothetical protein